MNGLSGIADYSPAGTVELIVPYLGVLAFAFLGAMAVTPLMRRLALNNGIVDLPDQRKRHTLPVAYLGGVAIFLGWLVGVAMGHFVSQAPPFGGGEGTELATVLARAHVPLGIVLGAAAITCTGLFDDVYGISPQVKIGGQLFAAAALASQDVGLRLVEASLELMGLSAPHWAVFVLGTGALAVFVVGGCNAFNLLDGMDGLVAGVTAIGCAGLLAIAVFVASMGQGPAAGADAGGLGFTIGIERHDAVDSVRVVMCLAILGAVLGFLPHNFHPARIFMGDAGALLLGFLVMATILLFAAEPGSGPKLVTAGLIVFMVPIVDTTLAIVRRKMRGQRVSEPDNEHLHHMLLAWGLNVRQAVAVLYAAALGCAVLGFVLVATQQRWRYVLTVFALLLGATVACGVWLQMRQSRPVGKADSS